MSSNMHQDISENTCVVCFKNVSVFSIGECDHPVCYECSTRMRVLCRQNECPICRQDMPKVVFTKEIRPFRSIKHSNYAVDKKYKICFEDRDAQKCYNKLLEHVCCVCYNRPAFRTFQNLKDHMRKDHELFYCDLCVDNLKIFSVERRCYTRQELALHRRRGDVDDKSHKGHPLCEFCDQRYMDNDELFRHLRRDHLFCHFCDADGFHQYYSSYDYLREHFRTEHFLCEEGSCAEEKFTSVFRTEIDLKAHRASVHGKTIGKAAAKQARTLELEFTLAPRPRERDRPDNRRGPGRNRVKQEEEESIANTEQLESASVFHRAPNINTDCIDEFPTLGGTASISLPNTDRSKAAVDNGVTIRTMRKSTTPLAINDVNFPALGPESNVSNCKTVRLSVNSTNHDRSNNHVANIVKSGLAKPPTNVSIHVNRRLNNPSGKSIPAQNTNAKIGINKTHFDKEFPTLSSSSSTTTHVNTHTQSSGVKPRVLPRPQQTKSFRSEEEFPSLNSKFTTDCSVESGSKIDDRSKKASSVMIPVSNTWSETQNSNSVIPVNNAPAAGGVVNGNSNIKVKSRKKKTKNLNCPSSDTTDRSSMKKEEQKQKSSESKGSKLFKTLEKNINVEENVINKSSHRPCERKRSELLIGSLSTDDSSTVSRDTLSSSYLDNVVSAPPPGFQDLSNSSNTLLLRPPPGFGPTFIKEPPPGFSVTNKKITMPQSNGLTFTNSSGESYPISPDGSISEVSYHTPAYIMPPNFDRRNETLAFKVEIGLKNSSTLQEFRKLSKLFRDREVSAKDYYDQCQVMMGADTFLEIFPELIALLPDIERQQDLWSVQTSTSSYMYDQYGLKQCSSCKQLLSKNDFSHHIASHALETDYPMLSTYQ